MGAKVLAPFFLPAGVDFANLRKSPAGWCGRAVWSITVWIEKGAGVYAGSRVVGFPGKSTVARTGFEPATSWL